MDFDLIIIGCGSAGVEAAKEALKYTKRVLCIEKSPEEVGGTCLNRGCVPTKFLREGALLVERINSSSFYSIEANLKGLNLVGAISNAKKEVIKPIREATYKYLKSKGVKFCFTRGVSFISPFEVKTKEGKTYKGRYFLIATGSAPSSVPAVVPDGEFVLDTDSFWEIKEFPERVLIVGGGVSGVEFANVLKTYGVKEVILVELLRGILPTSNYPRDMVRRLERTLKAKGIKILTQTAVEEIDKTAKRVKLTNGETFEVNRVLLTVGRKPNTEGLNLEGVGVKLSPKGFVEVNEHYQSSVSHIYAAGDVIPTPALAHAAKHEAVCAVKNIFREAACSIDYQKVPSIVYSALELGGFGKGEEELKKEGVKFKPLMATFRSVAKALAEREEGLVKVLISPSGEILGGFVLSKKHTDSLIHLLLMAKENGWEPQRFREFIFAHPTVEEVLENL